MSFMKQPCVDQLTKDGVLPLLPLTVQWIAGREYKRAKGTAADVAAWDAAVKNALDNTIKDPKSINTFDGGVETNTFAATMLNFVQLTGWCPGWNEASCSFDWGEFACFCSSAVDQTAEDLLKFAVTVTGPFEYFCKDPKIKVDPIYQTMPGETPAGAAKKKTNWTPWIIGGAAVVVVGGGAVYMLKRKPARR